MKKIFIQEIFVVLKVSAFYFEISTFSSPDCCISFMLHCIYCSWYVVSNVWLSFTGAHLEFIEGRGLKFSKICIKDKLLIPRKNLVKKPRKKLKYTQYVS